MGFGESIGNLRRESHCLLRRQRPRPEPVLQRFTLDHFHDEEVHAILMTDLMQVQM
jgi:hypothetical protein